MKNRKPLSKKKLQGSVKWDYILKNAEVIVDVIVLIIPILAAVGGEWINSKLSEDSKIIRFVFVIVAVAAFIVKGICISRRWITRRKFETIQKAVQLTENTLAAFKKANAAKTRSILQATYGRVPEWRPTNYVQNVLVYDVHEQLRAILIGLQEMIISTTDGFNEDNVSVDLVYCYPSLSCRGFDGALPARRCSQSPDGKDGWRLITSGGSSYRGSIHALLEDKGSFFCYLDRCEYAFVNDKRDCEFYIMSTKDKEYGSTGSIVGIKVVVKNDEPEKTFVEAILTITTYGRKLYEESDGSTLEDYMAVFKEHIINSYLCLITSELSQMYIRHAIKDGWMCRFTGRACIKKEKPKTTHHCCSSQNEAGSCCGSGVREEPGKTGCDFCPCGKCERDETFGKDEVFNAVSPNKRKKVGRKNRETEKHTGWRT